MAYGQWRSNLRFGVEEFGEVLRAIEVVQRCPGLTDFDVRFLASCKEQLTTRRYLSEKQRALIARIAEREAQALVGLEHVRELAKVVERLPEKVRDQFYSIQAQAETPGRVLTEKQVLWLEKTRDIATLVPPPPLAALMPGLADNPDQCVQAMLDACLVEIDLLGKRECERLREFAEQVAERGAFTLYRSEVEELVAAYAKLQEKLAGLSATQLANRAQRTAATEVLARLEAKHPALTATERSLLRMCRATVNAGYLVGLQQARALLKAEARLQQREQVMALLEAGAALAAQLPDPVLAAMKRSRDLIKRGRVPSAPDLTLLQSIAPEATPA